MVASMFAAGFLSLVHGWLVQDRWVLAGSGLALLGVLLWQTHRLRELLQHRRVARQAVKVGLERRN